MGEERGTVKMVAWVAFPQTWQLSFGRLGTSRGAASWGDRQRDPKLLAPPLVLCCLILEWLGPMQRSVKQLKLPSGAAWSMMG